MQSDTFEKVKTLIAKGEVVISSHGYDELAEDGILVEEILASVTAAEVIEDYPDFAKGPCCLVLHYDDPMRPIHVVWGIARGSDTTAVLITAYRPDAKRWSDDFKRRKS